MTSSERMLIGKGVIGAKKNLPWEGKDRKALTWLGGEFFSKFWKVGWLLKQEGSGGGGLLEPKRTYPGRGRTEKLYSDWGGVHKFIDIYFESSERMLRRGKGVVGRKRTYSGRGRIDKLRGKEVVGAKKLTLGGEGWRSSILTGGGVSTATSGGTWHVQHLQIIVFSVTAGDTLFSFVFFKNLL